jgi:ABC-type phosphate transport system substrate-binding protein
MQSHTYSITFINYYDAVNASQPYAHMVNKAGTVVAPTTETVQSAMADFITELAENNFALDIFDGNGTNSWPLSYMSFFSMNRNVTTFDCTNILELLNFVAWVHTNDAYVQASPLHATSIVERR